MAPDVVSHLALPELWCRIEQPTRVTFLEAMRKDALAQTSGARKRPAMLAKVLNLDEPGAPQDLAMPVNLVAIFAVIPVDGYVGRTYRITRHRRHERKNALGYTVEELKA